MSRDRRAEIEARRARPEFVNALREVLGLAPLTVEADERAPIYHDGWPAPRDGCRRVAVREAS